MTLDNHAVPVALFFLVMGAAWTMGLTPFFLWLDKRGTKNDDVHRDD